MIRWGWDEPFARVVRDEGAGYYKRTELRLYAMAMINKKSVTELRSSLVHENHPAVVGLES